MRGRIQQWGNSLALRIPKPFAQESGLRRQTEVEMSLDDARIVITPVREKRTTLAELLAQVTDENCHAEIDVGPAAGKEV